MAARAGAGRRSAPIRRYMTRNPVTIASRRSLAEAHRLMRRSGFRHLPVVEEDRLVGIVSLRDLHLLQTLRDVDPERITVQEAMTAGPYAVHPGTPIDCVVREMAEHKWGSAIVAEEGRVLGVFTTTDALRLLARLLVSPPAGRRRSVPDA